MSGKKFTTHSTRLCRRCRKFTTFKYDFHLGHSACSCGNRFGMSAKAIIGILTELGYDINKVKQEEER